MYTYTHTHAHFSYSTLFKRFSLPGKTCHCSLPDKVQSSFMTRYKCHFLYEAFPAFPREIINISLSLSLLCFHSLGRLHVLCLHGICSVELQLFLYVLFFPNCPMRSIGVSQCFIHLMVPKRQTLSIHNAQ